MWLSTKPFTYQFHTQTNSILPIMMTQYSYSSDTEVNLSVNLSTTDGSKSLYELLHNIKAFQSYRSNIQPREL